LQQAHNLQKKKTIQKQKLTRLANSRHQPPRFCHLELPVDDGIVHYSLGFHPLISHHNDPFCFLVEVVSSVVCQLQGYGGLGTNGPGLGGSICDSYWNHNLFFCG
jgi:hypothetical protein